MEELYYLREFLPYSFKNKQEEKYIELLWGAFEVNYKGEKYEFASLALHLLYMSFFSFSVWQIRAARKDDFAKAMVGFDKDVETLLYKAESPFDFFARVKESTIVRFSKLIGCDNQQIGGFARFLKGRHKIAHPSGTVFFNDKDDLDRHLAEVTKELEIVQGCMKLIVQECLRYFLIEYWDENTWQFSDPADQIREMLIHTNYFSQKDIEDCLKFEIAALENEEGYEQIKKLFDVFVKEYIKEST